MIEQSGEALYLSGWSVRDNAGYRSDVTLAFEDAQVILPFSGEETDDTDDKDDTVDTDDTNDTDDRDDRDDTDNPDDRDDINDTGDTNDTG